MFYGEKLLLIVVMSIDRLMRAYYQQLSNFCGPVWLFDWQTGANSDWSCTAFCCDIDISQGSVATCLRYDGIFKYVFIINILQNLTVKKFRKWVNIWWSYGQESCVFTHSVIDFTGHVSDLSLFAVNVLKIHTCTTWFLWWKTRHWKWQTRQHKDPTIERKSCQSSN